MIRPLAALALAALALLGSGCAMLGRDAAAPADEAAATAAAPAVQVEVDAPGALKALLERHLDLSRLATLARGEAIGELELTRLIDATPAQVRELLQAEGFFTPEVAVEHAPAARAGEPARVKVSVRPGVQARVGRVDIEIEGDLARAVDGADAAARATLASLRGGWPLKVGGAFRNPDWSDAKAAALARLRAAGYAAAAWSGTAADVDVQQGRVRLYLVADSGPLFRSGEVAIEGLKMHDRRTVLNLADFDPGTPVTEALLLDFQDRLLKSGLFEHVAVTLDTDPAQAGAARISVRLSELLRHQVIAGVGVSANAGPRATLEHVYRRVFGFAATARNALEWGRSRQAWNGELSSHPGPGLTRNVVGVTIERLKTDADVVLSQRLRVGRTQDSPRIERFYFVEYDRNTRRTDTDRTESDATTLNYHWVWRRIDNPLLPTEGLTLSLQGGAGSAGSSATGRTAFGRVYGRITGYLPLARQWYGQARLELGQIVGGGNVAIPDTQRFRAGGDDSVRGYAYRTLGPVSNGAVGSGDVLMTASVELARPILASMPSLWGAVFVDAGNASNAWRDLRPVVGTGVGLRWRSPVGPLRLDWAYAPDLGRGRLHFSVGIVF